MAVIVDFPGTGEMITSQGNIPVLTDQDALVNSINLWLCSFQGERLYRPNEGGLITRHLLKPMSGERANDMRDDITDGLAHQFTPYISVSECSVIPDYERNTYWIEIKGYCPSLKVAIFDKVGLKPLA
jgi:phage baseplate assembly protein W